MPQRLCLKLKRPTQVMTEPGMTDNDLTKQLFSRGVDLKTIKLKQNTATIMKKLLADRDGSISDKIATVKIAHHVDKGRFETAIKTLMSK